MKKFVAKLLIASQLLCNFAFAGKIQNEDVKSLSDLTGAGGTAAQLINDSKIYVTANGLNEQLSAAITNGDIGGAAANGINYFSNFKANGTTGFSSCNETQTFTVTIASPAVFTSASAHGFALGQALTFSTSGVLPTGLTAGTTYYVSSVPSGTTYQVSATLGGASVNTSGSQSGTNTQYPATPITCSSGSLSGLALTASSVSPLRYASSFLLTQTNSSKVQGQGIAYNYSIATADQAKMINVSFDYNASSTFVASSGLAGATGASGIDSDLEIYMYDVTNAVAIPILPKVITANGANNYTYKGSFQTNSNSTSYRMIIYASTPNANSTGWTFKFVNVQIGPQTAATFGAPVTDWKAYTLTIGAVTTAPTAGTSQTLNQAYWRRIGDSMEIHYDFFQTSAGSAGSGAYLFPLPPGYSIDGNKIDITQGSNLSYNELAIVGIAQNYPTQSGHMAVYNATNLSMFTSGNFVGVGGNGTLNNATIRMTFQALVPIAGWGSTTTLSQDTDTRVVTGTATRGTSQTGVNPNNSSVQINLNALLPSTIDTHSAWNFTTFSYVAPISGNYMLDGSVDVGASNVANGAHYGVQIYLNGSLAIQGDNVVTTNNNFTRSASGVLNLKAGDAVSLYLFSDANNSSSTLTVNATSGTRLSATRISGPATIAVSETVAASYYASANVSCSNTVPINFDTKVIDTHNAVTVSGTAWKFTAPTAGNYDLGGLLSVTSSSGVNWSVYKNGSSYKFVAQPANGTYGIPPNSIIPMLAGDYIDVRPQSSFTCQGGALNASGSLFDVHLIK